MDALKIEMELQEDVFIKWIVKIIPKLTLYYTIDYNSDGSLLAATGKDKYVRCYDE